MFWFLTIFKHDGHYTASWLEEGTEQWTEKISSYIEPLATNTFSYKNLQLQKQSATNTFSYKSFSYKNLQLHKPENKTLAFKELSSLSQNEDMNFISK